MEIKTKDLEYVIYKQEDMIELYHRFIGLGFNATFKEFYEILGLGPGEENEPVILIYKSTISYHMIEARLKCVQYIANKATMEAMLRHLGVYPNHLK